MEWTRNHLLVIGGIAVLFLFIGMMFGQPVFISLEESERNTVIAKEERACAKQLREIQRGFVDKVSALDDGLDRCFERNRELLEGIDSFEASIIGKIEDLNSSVLDVNSVIADLNCHT